MFNFIFDFCSDNDNCCFLDIFSESFSKFNLLIISRIIFLLILPYSLIKEQTEIFFIFLAIKLAIKKVPVMTKTTTIKNTVIG